jgi:hypothetical protein
MYQYKTVAQILLILFIFNLVFAAPVVREIYDPHDDVMVPVVARNVEAMSKERRQSGSDGPTPPHSSPPPSDGLTPSHSSPPSPDGPMPLQGLSPSDGPAPLLESPSPPGGPTALAVSSPPGGTASLSVVPASDQPVPVHSTSTSQDYTAVTHDMVAARPPSPEAQMDGFRTLGKAIGVATIVITGGLLWYHRHSLHHRMIGPDWYVSNPSNLSCRRLNVGQNALGSESRSHRVRVGPRSGVCQTEVFILNF